MEAQLAEHWMVESGYEQAPVPSQPLALQVGSPVEQACAQQLPLPSTPQTPEAHSGSEVQCSPGESRTAAPVVPVEELVVPLPPEPLQAAARQEVTIAKHRMPRVVA